MLSQLFIYLSNSSWFDLVTRFSFSIPNGMTSKVELPFAWWKSKLQCFYLLLCWDLSNFSSSITISHRFLVCKIQNAEPSLTPLPFTCTSYEKLSFSSTQGCCFSLLTSNTLQSRSSSLQPAFARVWELDWAPHPLFLPLFNSSCKILLHWSLNTPLPGTTVLCCFLHSSNFL